MHKRTYCIFTLPILLLLIYCGAALSNVLPVTGGEKRIAENAPGLIPSEVTVASGETPDGDFNEPAWIDFRVCRMLYEELSEKEREAYRALYDAVLEHRETVYIPLLSSEELSRVHAALKYDNPQLPCISDEFSYGSVGGLCYVKMQYAYTKAECDALSETLIATAGMICADCAGQNDYARELYLHDTLVRLADYADGGVNANTAAGTLVDGKGVCAGYALGMKLLCDVTGLDSCIVRGTAENENGAESHAWLVVRLGDSWYHVDPTWDDPVSAGDADQLTHAYFNLPTEWISADHSGFTLPEGVRCDSTADNYYAREGLLCGPDDWRELMRDELDRRLPGFPLDIEFRFADGDLFDSVYAELMDGAINRLMNELIRENGFPIERWQVSLQTFRSMNCLRLVISDDSD